MESAVTVIFNSFRIMNFEGSTFLPVSKPIGQGSIWILNDTTRTIEL